MSQRMEMGARVAQETLTNLIRQFSDEMAFLRELIQNSMDAGSSEVEVRTQYHDDKGLATLAVVDFGEGMTRDIIDTKLTRLFASGKEDDYTKIGKFGIGFVSVFALEPEVVVVDTGRSGESWRLLFKPGGTFERIRLADPVEGTSVTVYKSMPRAAYDDVIKRAQRTVSFWCRHAQAQIRFNGKPINEPFDVEGAIKASYSDAFTEVVVALSTEATPFYGFYNHGLTLLEGHDAAVMPGVTFKIKSRYLEHTLTRDNVKKDANYDKAMKILRRLVDVDLKRQLFTDLASAAGGKDVLRYHQMLNERVPHLRSRWAKEGRRLPLVRSLHSTRAWSLDELHGSVKKLAKLRGRLLKAPASAGVVLFDDRPTPLTQELEQRTIAVVATETAMLLRDVLSAQGIGVARAGEVMARAVPVRPAPSSAGKLLEGTTDLLARCRIRLRGVEVVALEGSPTFAAALPVVVAQGDGALVAGGNAALGEDESPPRWPMSLLPRGRLLLNAGHPLIEKLCTLWKQDADTATYALAKIACLTDGIHPLMEDRLLSAHRAAGEEALTAEAVRADLESCLGTALSALHPNEMLEAALEVEDLGVGGPIAEFKGMRVVLNGAHPYLKGGRRGPDTTFRLASAVYTCFNRALDRIRDHHEITFIHALAEWRLTV